MHYHVTYFMAEKPVGEPFIYPTREGAIFDALCALNDFDAIRVESTDKADSFFLTKKLPKVLNALHSALDVLECNCGDECEGTCSYGLVKAAIQEATSGQI